MPTLKIMSVYQARKAMYAERLARARAELEEFDRSLVVRLGKETADAVRQWAAPTKDMFLGKVKVPKLTDEGEDAVETLRTLAGKVAAVVRKTRTPSCWFRESPVPVSVLETVGWSWKEVEERFVADGRLSLPGVLRLLRVLRTIPQVMPCEEQVWVWAGSGVEPCHLPHEWRRVLRSRRRRLVILLRTAAELEEEVRYGGG
jgi:hypothetical protein